MITRATTTLLAALAFSFTALAEIDTVPTCPSPQAIGTTQALAGLMGNPTALAWNGREYGTLFYLPSSTSIWFQRVYADGTPASAAVSVVSGGSSVYAPTIAWNGSGWAIAYSAISGGFYGAYFARLTESGTSSRPRSASLSTAVRRPPTP